MKKSYIKMMVIIAIAMLAFLCFFYPRHIGGRGGYPQPGQKAYWKDYECFGFERMECHPEFLDAGCDQWCYGIRYR